MEAGEQRAEQARVDQVEREIKRQVATAEQAVDEAHQETRAVEKNYSENASINRYEVDDIAESRSELEQQRRLVSQAAENENSCGPCKIFRGPHTLGGSTSLIRVKTNRNACISGLLPS